MFISFPDTILDETGATILDETSAGIFTEQHFYTVIEDGVEANQIAYDTEDKSGAFEMMTAQQLAFILFANIHYGPSGTGNVAEPTDFEITVKSGDFEIRRPL